MEQGVIPYRRIKLIKRREIRREKGNIAEKRDTGKKEKNKGNGIPRK